LPQQLSGQETGLREKGSKAAPVQSVSLRLRQAGLQDSRYAAPTRLEHRLNAEINITLTHDVK